MGGNDRLPVATSLTLNGGTLRTAGFNQTAGIIDLDAPSTIDFGASSSNLVFSDSDAQNWGGFQLDITNWTAGSDTLRIGTEGTGFDTQLASIRFVDQGNIGAQVDSNGFITPIPEPGSIATLGLLVLAARRRRN